MNIKIEMIIFSTINFFIFFLILKKFVFNKTLGVINGRKAEVENSLQKAIEEEKRAELLKTQYNQDVLKYKKEGLKLVESYKEKADKIYAEVIEDSQKEAIMIKEKAAKDIEREKTKASKEMRQEIIDLSMKLAEKTLEKEISKNSHKDLIDEFITKVGI